MENDAYLFVYGTLRSQMNDPLHHLLEILSSWAPVLSRKAVRYWALPPEPSCPAETPIGSWGDLSASHGGLYKFWMNKEGHRFRRKRVTIFQEDGKSIDCWIYLYARSVKRPPPLGGPPRGGGAPPGGPPPRGGGPVRRIFPKSCRLLRRVLFIPSCSIIQSHC